MADVAVLVMAYGTPAGLDEVEDYYTHIRRGRAPTPELLADLVARYEAIGGASPLRDITERQAAGLQAQLESRETGRFEVFLGMKHAAPFIEDATERIVAAGHDDVVGLVLAPHRSGLGVGQYHERARAALGRDVRFRGIESWYRHPDYIGYLGDEVATAMERVPEPARARTHVLFTAHSLPTRIVAEGGTYPMQLRETAELVSERLDLQRRSIAWQSAGRTSEPWLGPDILEVLPALADAHGMEAVVVCPCGFVADHLEVLYDVDIEAHQVAAEHGLEMQRTAMPNDDPRLLSLLADVVIERASSR
ncbi:MAG: ferrochelatase [Actinobacteria bacterium]|nr:ferrochelatase [Actinomycetota bacterium]